MLYNQCLRQTPVVYAGLQFCTTDTDAVLVRIPAGFVPNAYYDL